MSQIIHPKNEMPMAAMDEIRGGGYIPAVQSVAEIQKQNYITVYMNPSPPTTCLSSGTLVWFDLQPRIAQHVKNFDLRINITCSSAQVHTLPAPYWFKRISFRTNKGAGDYIWWVYPENMVLHYALMEPVRRRWYESHGMVRFIEGKEDYKLTYPIPLEVGETRDVYIPLPMSFWDMGAIHFQHMTQDLRIEIEFDSDFAYSGTTTNITVNNIAAVIEQYDLTGEEQMQWVADFKSNVHYFNYLDCMVVKDNSKTMTVSSKTNFDLQNFICKSPFLLVVIKPSTSPVASDHSKYRPLEWGDDATIEIENPSNEPLLGKGNPPKLEYLEKRFVEMTGKKPIRGFYLINFNKSIYDSFNGTINGFYPFAGIKDTLAITFGAAGRSEVHTLTADAAASAGSWKIMFDGKTLTTVAYNETVGNVQTNIRAAEPFKRWGYTPVVAGPATLASTTGVTFTFNVQKDGGVYNDHHEHIVEIVGQDGSDATFAGALTTTGKAGWATSSSNQIEIYCYYFRRLMVGTDGVLSTRTL